MIRENLAENQAQINTIQAEITSTSVQSITAKLKSVQKQIKDIQTQIDQCPESSSTEIAELHKLIEAIYGQIIDKINKKLTSIERQVGDSTDANPSLSPKLETLRKQVEVIQETISGTVGGPVITALQIRLN